MELALFSIETAMGTENWVPLPGAKGFCVSVIHGAVCIRNLKSSQKASHLKNASWYFIFQVLDGLRVLLTSWDNRVFFSSLAPLCSVPLDIAVTFLVDPILSLFTLWCCR